MNEPSFYELLFNKSPVGMIVFDKNYKPVKVNKNFLNIANLSREVLDEKGVAALLDGDNLEKWKKGLDKLINSNRPSIDLDCRYQYRENRYGWLKFNITMVKEGGRSLFYALVEDVTYQKTAEHNIKNAVEIAQRAARARSEFLANISHEIRTPIHTIIGMTELLLKTHLDQEQVDYSQRIVFSADVLLSLINDFLDFSKIEAGHLTLETVKFDLYQLVEDAVDIITLEAHEKGLEVGMFIDKTTPHLLLGDPLRLRQVIVNLFSNAVKFTEKGEIVIYVHPIEETRNYTTIQFSVVDTGIGIPEDKIINLFEAFKQVDSSTSRKYGGTGLGLAISSKLVRLMGGEFSVESTYGEGSSFSFTACIEKQEEENLYTGVDGNFFEKMKVLLVDDNKKVRKIIKRYLKDWGCDVYESRSGENAYELLTTARKSGTPFELCIIDQQMPGIDGWQLANRINSNKNVNSTKTILMSLAGMGEIESKMKLLNWFNGYLVKPVKRRDLLEAVFNIMNDTMELEVVEVEKPAPPVALSDDIVKNKTILLAEDHEVNRDLFVTILSKLGFTVFTANDGFQAVQQVGDRTPDLIFMDIQMPGMNGYEATMAIRDQGIDIPIIAVTANALNRERDRCLECGMNDFITKPFRQDDLIPVILRWLPSTDLSIDYSAEKPKAHQSPTISDERMIFYFEGALEAFMNDEVVLEKVVNKYMLRTEDQLNELEELIEKDEFEGVRGVAHAIKGSSWNLDIQRVGDTAAALEQAGKDQDGDKMPQVFEALKYNFKELKEYLHTMEEFGK